MRKKSRRLSECVGGLALLLLAACDSSTGPIHVSLSGTWRAAANTVGPGAGITMTLTEDAEGNLAGTWTRECAEPGCPQTGSVSGTHTQEISLTFVGYDFCADYHGTTCLRFTYGFRGAPFRNFLNGYITPYVADVYPTWFQR